MPELLKRGFRDIRDIPADFLTNENQERVRRVTKSGKFELSPDAGDAVRAIPYPRRYFDFETIQFAVPIWKGTRPYQQIPFQWSCHTEGKDGGLQHQAYLDTTGSSPMEGVAAALLRALGQSGPILSHGAGFEKRCLSELAKMVPQRARELRKLLPRFIDTLSLARAHYYHPKMMGSWSLKQIVPSIAPELDYKSLKDVRDGGQVSEAYLEIISPDTTKGRKNRLRAALQRYCARDTLALVRMLRFFRRGK